MVNIRICRPAASRAAVLLVSLPIILAFAGAASRVHPAETEASVAAAATGSVTGIVQVGPEIERRRVRFPIYADMSRQAANTPEPSLDDELKNVIVHFEDVAWKGQPGRGREMRQINEAFEPHVLPILVGTTVDFPNADPFFHNVFSLSMASAFDLGHYPKGSSRSVVFDTPGLVKVFCHLHSNMSAVIMVLDNPFFTTPGEDGRYRIEGVPPGSYTVVAWHERARPVRREVTIEAGRTVSLDLRVPIHDGPVPE